MAAPKRSKLEREAQLPEIEALHNRGHSVRAIGELFGLSHVVILRDLETIAERYRAAALTERGEGVSRQIAALRDVRREAWEAWQRSKEDASREVREEVRRLASADAGEALERLKVVETTEGRLPANEYLATILRTWQEEAKLLGLYAPKNQKVEHSGPGGKAVEHVVIYVPDDSRNPPPAPSADGPARPG